MVTNAPVSAPLAETAFPPDWQALGLACAILGCFLVANAILFRHPRRLVREFFGTVQPRLTRSATTSSTAARRTSGSST